MENILKKLKKAGLVGRGGACFPTWLKWDMIKKAEGKTKYIICNASEGEPGVKKDGYILEHFGEQVIDGIKIAINFLSNDVVLKQRTPKRVSHRRADKIRNKKVYSVQSKIENENEIESIIVCDGGCYVKELISGDEGRTSPNIADTVGIKAYCKELDVLEIDEKAYSKEK